MSRLKILFKQLFLIQLFMLSPIHDEKLSAAPLSDIPQTETADTTNTIPADQPYQEKKSKSFWEKTKQFVGSLSGIDENYIEPQHYLYTAMLQATYTYDYYTLRSKHNSQSISFAPDGSMEVGPYLGWRWVFGGYTLTLGSPSFKKTKTEWDFSFYTSRIGIDLFYRRTGNDYKIRNASFDSKTSPNALEREPFDGIQAGITGINLYYIFNHRRFSYPAAFAQSTCQKISCGSWMAGIGYTKNTLSFDYDRLQSLINDRLGNEAIALDSGLMFKSAEYYDISASAGYAYNKVFAKDFLFCASGQLAVAYKKSSGRTAGYDQDDKFSFSKFNPNLVGRFSVVYNNTRWYAGFSAIIRSNNYISSRFSTNNTFGNINMYIGYNFGLKKRYRKQ